ncbi:MAG: 2-oxo acid dehydrogenase subunit E2, partial [Chlamydiia bacterium]|nr:2-oxo acid dehydrogenase subunit E2 [Chlamydiia bacterium]
CDMTRLMRLKSKITEDAALEGIKVTFMPFFIRALSLCIDRFPILNSSLDNRKKAIVYHKPHNIGIAMAAPYGLIVPVLKGVQNMTLEQVIKGYQELKQKGFDNKLTNSDMKEGTLTLTNFGALPGMSTGGTPIINYPEAAICGVARVQKRPKVVNDEIKIRELMNVSFSFDHRIIDGQVAAQIAQLFCNLLENPAKLL